MVRARNIGSFDGQAMRDIFDDISKNQPFDPMESARRGARPNLRKRFYGSAGLAEREGGVAVELDGKPVRTPARRLLAAPARALAEAIAAEWDAQAKVIDPARMPLTRLANSIIDGVADAPGPVGGRDREISRLRSPDTIARLVPRDLVARQTQLGTRSSPGRVTALARASCWPRV